MTDPIDLRSAHVDDALPELALGLLPGPEQDAVQRHIAGCDRCRAELDAYTAVADQLTSLAPDAEPPLGFEQRAVAAMGVPATNPPSPARRAVVRSGLRGALLAAAALLVLVAVGALLALALRDDTSTVATRSGVFIDADGDGHGTALLADAGTSSDPRTTLTMTLDGLPAGTYHCLVTGRSGDLVTVASWPVADRGAHSWTIALTRETDATDRIVIHDERGDEVAAASLR